MKWTFLIVASLFLGGCDVETGDFYKDRMAAEDATQRLHELYNRRKFEDIYELAAPEMKQAVSREAFIDSAAKGFERYGQFRTTKQAGTSCIPHQVRLVYLSEYEKGPATEMLAWSVFKGKARLLAFHVADGHSPPAENNETKCPS